MRKNLLLFILCSVITLSQAQNKVFFNISHYLGGSSFTLDNTGNNDLNTPFKITRLEYYISEISLVHDGGKVTPVDNYWILADVTKRSSFELGVFDIQHLEKVIFHIGVDPAHNNADPSVYPEGHPLALKEPAMHWGWASGYNFIALEGEGGNLFESPFQIHTLGNENYRQQEIVMNVEASNGQLTIPVRADYDMAMRELDASIGIFYHGPTKFAIKLAENFQKYVFSWDKTASKKSIQNTTFQVQPNLIPYGHGEVTIHTMAKEEFDISISAINGIIIKTIRNLKDGSTIKTGDMVPGIYFITMYRKGQPMMVQRLVTY